MATSLCKFLHHLTLLLIFFTIPSLSHDDDEGGEGKGDRGLPLIKSICEDTNFYNLCVSSLKSNPRSSKVSIKDLGPITVDLVLANATEVSSYINKLIEKAQDSTMKKCLKLCRTHYDFIIGDLKEAVKYLKSDVFEKTLDCGPVGEWLMYVQGNITRCGNNFKHHPGLETPLKEKNKLLQSLADNSFVIIGDEIV